MNSFVISITLLRLCLYYSIFYGKNRRYSPLKNYFIVDLIGTIDDKVENNEITIAKLEQLATSLYRHFSASVEYTKIKLPANAKEFEKTVKPLYEKILYLADENAKLAELKKFYLKKFFG